MAVGLLVLVIIVLWPNERDHDVARRGGRLNVVLREVIFVGRIGGGLLLIFGFFVAVRCGNTEGITGAILWQAAQATVACAINAVFVVGLAVWWNYHFTIDRPLSERRRSTPHGWRARAAARCSHRTHVATAR